MERSESEDETHLQLLYFSMAANSRSFVWLGTKRNSEIISSVCSDESKSPNSALNEFE